MKKTYKKPVVIVEDFSLQTSIARNCEEALNLSGNDECGVEFGSYIIFLENVTGCQIKVQDGDSRFNRLCYHIPQDSNNVFNS